MQHTLVLIACMLMILSSAAYEDDDEVYHDPNYEFTYGVRDDYTGDIKSAWEKRKEGQTKGEYSLEDADGTHRVVAYKSDGKKGFQPVVTRFGHAHHPPHFVESEEEIDPRYFHPTSFQSSNLYFKKASEAD